MQLKKRFTLLTVEQKDKVLKDIKNINELQPYKNLDYKLNQQITVVKGGLVGMFPPCNVD